ncbi:hypothetical protein L1987_23984 [Smallanthus sonchifolius]|uniref:Uncharacterized protein n=1 Tax=Smallanthus sonchifolius TaxID=185202 RepID=A0ACB9IIF3_9ASTR|nr:hypothetical protein L1987_23984 [Smallanthus sonchifolius]
MFIIGNDQTIYDFTCVENVAHAFICAEATLTTHMLIISEKTDIKLHSKYCHTLELITALQLSVIFNTRQSCHSRG